MVFQGLWGTCTNGVNWGCDRTSFGQEILPPIMSGKVTSHAAIKYGRVNVRARIPKGDWIWPGLLKSQFIQLTGKIIAIIA